MKRSSAENSKLFASPVALSKVEKGRKSTFFLQNNLLLFLLKIAVVGVHIAAVNLAEQPAEWKNQEQAPHHTCLFLYKKWWHIASPPIGNQRNIFVCFIWRQSREATGAGWREVLFGRSALEDWKTGAKYYLEERCRRTDRQKTLPVIVAPTFEKYRHPQLSTEGSPAEFFWRTLKFETTFSESRSKQVAEYFVAGIFIIPGKAMGCSRKKTNHFQNDSLFKVKKRHIGIYGVSKILLVCPAIIRGKY